MNLMSVYNKIKTGNSYGYESVPQTDSRTGKSRKEAAVNMPKNVKSTAKKYGSDTNLWERDREKKIEICWFVCKKNEKIKKYILN